MFGVGRCKLLYICVCVTESLYCTPETNNTINQPYFKKIKFLKETFSTKVTEGKVWSEVVAPKSYLPGIRQNFRNSPAFSYHCVQAMQYTVW